jgi:periplasmic divalent cation tolerance protein
VSDKAAACVNIVDKITSIYEWQGKIEKAHEVLLLIKTRRDLADRVEGTIKGFSSYDCPEVIVLPVVDGAPEYLNWITDTTTPR